MGASDRIFGSYIPRERLGDAETWRIAPLGSRQTAAGAAAARPVAELEQAAFERGRCAGHAEAAAEAARNRANHAARIDAVLAALRERFAELEGAGADRVLDLALAIAGQVVRREIERVPEAVVAAVREAVGAVIEHHAHPRVHVHPADAELLRAELGADPQLAGCRIVADPGVSAGGCRVEVPSAEVDATLETRWRRVVQALGITDLPLPPRAPVADPAGPDDARAAAGAPGS